MKQQTTIKVIVLVLILLACPAYGGEMVQVELAILSDRVHVLDLYGLKPDGAPWSTTRYFTEVDIVFPGIRSRTTIVHGSIEVPKIWTTKGMSVKARIPRERLEAIQVEQSGHWLRAKDVEIQQEQE